MKHHWFPYALGFVASIAIASVTFAAATHVKAATPPRISMGKKVKVTDYLVPGKTTIVDFMSPFCPVCQAMAPRVEKLHSTRDDIALVEVDVNRPGLKEIDWESPVMKQYKLESESLPHFKIFGPDGKLVAEGEKAFAMVTEWTK